MFMRACLANENNTLHIADVPVPRTGDYDVLVKIFATAVNRADLLQKKGQYNPPKGATDILGLEGVGEIVSIGKNVTKWKLLDRVMALLVGGGYAEYVAVHEDHICLIPEDLTYIEAAAIPEAWLTAFQLYFFVGQVKSGDNILVHAAASGVGTALLQLAKLNGIRCFATAGSTEKVNFCLDLGAYKAFNYKDGPFAPKVLEATEGKGVNILFDCVGGSYFTQNSDVISMDGRWIIYGALGGTKVDGDVLQVILRKRLNVVGSTLRNRSHEYKKELVSRFAKETLPHFSSKQLKPVVNQVFSLEEINDAHDYVEENKSIGKVIVKVIV